MILATKEKPEEGELKRLDKFAWFPKWVGDDYIWLHRYVQIYEYKIRKRPRMLWVRGSLSLPFGYAVFGGWDLINEYALL